MFLRSNIISQSRSGLIRRRTPEPFRLFDRLMRSADAGIRNARPEESVRSEPDQARPPVPGPEPARWGDDSMGKPGFQFRGIL